MKLLLDENLSPRIVKHLLGGFPGSMHVRALGLGQSTDQVIWDYAKQHDYAVTTLDEDFYAHSEIYGGPPLIVWLKCGNQPNKVIVEKLLHSQKTIEQVNNDPTSWCVEIY